MSRWILVLSLVLLSGCDVATVALIMGSQDASSGDDDAPLPATPSGFPPPFYKAWVANLVDADAERQAVFSNHGNPRTPPWTQVLPIANSMSFNPSAPATSINAVLIQVASAQNFELDSIEIMDDQDNVLEHASVSTWSSFVTNPEDFLGPPDGVTASTTAAGNDRAFIFTMFSGPAGIPRFRINGHGDTLPPNPGEVVAVGGGAESFFNESPGGLAVDGGGLIHVTLSIIDDDSCRLSRYTLAGVRQDFTDVSLDIATAGSNSVALNSAGDIFTTCSIGGGAIQVSKFDPSLNPVDAVAFASPYNGDRVEHNSIAVDSSGFIIVVGGMSTLASGRNHWRIKLPDTVSGAPEWQNSSPLDSTNPTTYWHAVTTGANDDIFMAGDLNSGLLGTLQVYTAGFDLDGDPQWDDSYNDQGGSPNPSDMGHAIGLDPSGNVFVGGMVGTAAGAKDGVLLRYLANGTLTADTRIIGAAGGDDEILDIAVEESGGTVYIYVAGYETVSGQGENMVVRKYRYDTGFNVFSPVWARTHHGGFGNDRAVSCALHGNNLVVAGYETNNTAQTKFVLRVYEK